MHAANCVEPCADVLNLRAPAQECLCFEQKGPKIEGRRGTTIRCALTTLGELFVVGLKELFSFPVQHRCRSAPVRTNGCFEVKVGIYEVSCFHDFRDIVEFWRYQDGSERILCMPEWISEEDEFSGKPSHLGSRHSCA